jgi:hypothetical protein
MWNINDQIAAISEQFPGFAFLARFPAHSISAFKHRNDSLNA